MLNASSLQGGALITEGGKLNLQSIGLYGKKKKKKKRFFGGILAAQRARAL